MYNFINTYFHIFFNHLLLLFAYFVLYFIVVGDFAIYLYIMATYQIPAPSPMSIKENVAENWTDLRSKLDNDEGKQIVAATLCTVMGADCKRIMDSLPS